MKRINPFEYGTRKANTAAATVIMVWDESEPDRDGDEVHIWFVQLGDDDGEPIGYAYKVYSESNAEVMARTLGRKYPLPVEWY